MLEITDLNVSIHRLPILRGISLTVPPEVIVGLVGRNGAGKTTTLRSVMGLIRARSGSISLGDTDLLRSKPYHRARLGIGYMPEERRLVPAMTVEENLLLPMWANRQEQATARLERVYELMPEVKEFASRGAAKLSGGQQKLVALARALMVARRALLLDEPFEGLAPALAERMGRALVAAKEEHRLAVLLAESEYRHVQRLADEVSTIERGEIQTPAQADKSRVL